MTEEVREKLSELNKGENNPMFGKKGEKHPLYGKTHSDEAKKKMRKPKSEETKKKMRKPKTEEHRLKISESKKGTVTALNIETGEVRNIPTDLYHSRRDVYFRPMSKVFKAWQSRQPIIKQFLE